jgi:hypothetical protein
MKGNPVFNFTIIFFSVEAEILVQYKIIKHVYKNILLTNYGT